MKKIAIDKNILKDKGYWKEQSFDNQQELERKKYFETSQTIKIKGAQEYERPEYEGSADLKVKSGKLVRVKVRLVKVKNQSDQSSMDTSCSHKTRFKIKSASITGDFFIHPEQGIFLIEDFLREKRINKRLLVQLKKTISTAGLVMIGITPEAIYQAILAAKDAALSSQKDCQ